jgi:hypothetical protein
MSSITDYIDRMIIEKQELDEKCLALKSFIETNPVFSMIDTEDRMLLASQLVYMGAYSETLEKRINKSCNAKG